MLTWSEPKRILTKHGERMLQTAEPTAAFWLAWKADKEALTSQGIAVSKSRDTGKWQVSRWSLPTAEEQAGRAASLEASRAKADVPLAGDDGTLPAIGAPIPCPEGLAYLQYQIAGIRYALQRKNTLIADEMGCLSGSTELRVNRAGRGFEITLEQLYIKFNGVHVRGNDRWDNTIPTRIKALCGEELRLHTIRAVVFSGHKETWRITLESGKQLQATPDHEFATPSGYVPLNNLRIGSEILTNGKFLDKDGYYRVTQQWDHPRHNSGAVYEHLLVMEQAIGRPIDYPCEHVHHVNGIRGDNRLENLQLISQVDHCAVHKIHRHLSQDKHGNKIVWIPHIDPIVRIEVAEVEPVYDIVMDDPHRNFVANGIIVHNCGKTIQACGIINALYSDPGERLNVLIVCPASIRLNWKRELRKWLVHPRSIGLIDSSNFFPTNEILICNYELLKRHRDRLANRDFALLIADECHYIKNEKAQRTKALLSIPAARSVYLTGTPILNRPIELFPLLSKLDPEGLGQSRFAYAKRYCGARRNRYGWDISGASNLAELQRTLRETIMVRRLKADVLTELPPKRWQIIELPQNGASRLITKEHEIHAQHAERLAALEAASDAAKVTGDTGSYHAAVEALRSAQVVLFNEMSKVRHDLALLKLPYLIEHIENSLEAGPVVCFVHHRDVAEAIANSFANRSALYHGDTPMWERQAQVDRFQDPDSAIDLFVGTIRAAGVGITLTQSSHVIFGELDWVPGVMQQAEDRTHRIGQKESVLIQHIVFDRSLDATVAKTLMEKAEVILQAMDGELDIAPAIATERSEIVYSEAPAADTTKMPDKKSKKLTVEITITEEQKNAALKAMQIVAGMCDGARQLDSQGFSMTDSRIGKSLAAAASLTPRQAVIAMRLANKYRRQLPAELLATIKEDDIA